MRDDDEDVFRDWKVHRVALRVSGDGVPIDDLGHMLGIEPTAVARKGEPVGGPGGLATYDADVWVWEVPAHEWLPFEAQIAAALDRLEPHRASLRDWFATSGVSGELVLGFGSGDGRGSAELSHELLERVVAFGLSISIDLFPPAG